MKIGQFKEYKNYIGSIEITNREHHGSILHIPDLVTYAADSLEELEKEYHKAVDAYIEFLKNVGRYKNE